MFRRLASGVCRAKGTRQEIYGVFSGTNRLAGAGAVPTHQREASWLGGSLSPDPLPSELLPNSNVKGMLRLPDLKKLVDKGEIDTTLIGFTDIYGRFMGKRLDATHFLEHTLPGGGTHACSYLLACDMDMTPLEGFKFANWRTGFGDVELVPDVSTLRIASWLDKTCMVICNPERDHAPVSIAPRVILQRQIDRARKKGYGALAALELEFYLYDTSYREARQNQYAMSKMRPSSDVVQDYHILQGGREEKFNQAFRRHLTMSGVPVEGSKGEAGHGQQELNLVYCDALTMADRHVVYKSAIKDIAAQLGGSVTFMAKPYTDVTGSGCHIHLNLTQESIELSSEIREPTPLGYPSNAFLGSTPIRSSSKLSFSSLTSKNGETCNEILLQFIAGLTRYLPDVMPFLAPNVNSYKRYQPQSWGPTTLAWSIDNRTAGIRVVGCGTKSLRLECRLPGADCNAYLALAAVLACGLEGMEKRLTPPPILEGDAYALPPDAPSTSATTTLPRNLRDATARMAESEFAIKTFGADVIEHYTTFFKAEWAAYDKAVTDWERMRYFEQI